MISPLARGFWWALAAAVSFGITTPAIARSGASAGPWFTATALYFGAALFAATIQGSPRHALATLRSNAATYAAIALVGGALAPAAFIAGLHLAGPLGSSLALNLEVVFGVTIARIVFAEHIGRRVVIACATILVGAIVLATTGERSGSISAIGIAFVALATLLWAVDNALSSTLRSSDTRVTVFWKSSIGAMLTLAIGLTTHDTLGPFASFGTLAIIGAIGYGASLWCYLQAQRTFGIARTASIFAIAPFVGALTSIVLGAGHIDATSAIVFILMAIGIGLHATERHAHHHHHHALEHEHLHRHDDDHHDHEHDDALTSGAIEHVHPHVHHALEHEHHHAPDPHHAHTHD